MRALVFGQSCRSCGASSRHCDTVHWVTSGRHGCCETCTGALLDWWGTPHRAETDVPAEPVGL